MSEDPCCFLCKTPSGVCALGHACDHHKEAEATEAASHRLTYRDPTGNTAVGNIMRERKRKRRRRMKT